MSFSRLLRSYRSTHVYYLTEASSCRPSHACNRAAPVLQRLALSEPASRLAQTVGRGLVRGMPIVLATLATVGIAAMLWVGGHILLVGADDLGWHGPYGIVHDLEQAVHDATAGAGAVLGWFTNTFASALVGLVVGAVVVAVMHLVPRKTSSH
ncbi:MAG: DUF808 family protein [Oxalobacteraceae bacterium]|nr:MAG: DUF808 family protein [Oxalobacteraceae bacterium]